MEYTDIISLEQAKNYLRIDPSFTGDDKTIERMICMAFEYITSVTNIYFKDQNKTYKMVNGHKRVYDYPINSVVSPLTHLKHFCYTLHTTYVSQEAVDGCCSTDLVLNIGFTSPDQVPCDLLEVAYELLDKFYNGDCDMNNKSACLSCIAQDILQRSKRFII